MAKLNAPDDAPPRTRRATRSASAQPPPTSHKRVRGRPRISSNVADASSQPVTAAPPGDPLLGKASTAPVADKPKQTKTARASISQLPSRSSRTVQTQGKVEKAANGESNQDLDTIPEDDDDEEGEMRLLALSGATAVGYNSDAEINELRKKCDTFVEELPDLVKVSSSFINALGEAPTFAEFTKRLETDQVLVRKAQKLIQQAHLYKSTEEPFIHPNAVVQAMFNTPAADEIQRQPWTPDPIFRHANLGLLVQRALTTSPESPDAVTLLQILDHSFCILFWGATIDSSPSNEAFDVALEIRTQLAIACIQQVKFHADTTAVIHEVFQDPRTGFVLRGWAQNENDRVGDYWIQEGAQKGITQKATVRVNHLLNMTSEHVELENLVASLLQDFSWQGFCDHLLRWIVSCAHVDLEHHINAMGGTERLVETLQERVEHYQNLGPSRPEKKASRSLAALRRVSASAKVADAQKKAKSNATTTTAIVPTTSSAQSKGKFYKAQPNATKVAPISQLEVNEDEIDVDPPVTTLQDSSSNGGLSELVTQDDGFQEQVPTNKDILSKKRSDAKARQAAKRKEVPEQSPGRLKRPRRTTVPGNDSDRAVSARPDDDDDFQPSLEEDAAPSAPRRAANSDHATGRESSVNLGNVKAQSKLATQAYNEAITKVPRSRIPWSPEEEACLVDLIEQHGTSWGLLKKKDTEAVGSQLQRRTPEDLRLKARLLKMDFLKTHQPLPDNFEDVKLNAAQIQKINDMGIAYLQPKVRGSS